MYQHFRVAVGAEEMPAGPQPLPQFAVVVDLAIEDHRHVARLVELGLSPPRQVDNAQPAHRQARRSIDQPASVVGAAMRHAVVHRPQSRLVGTATPQFPYATDAAHQPAPRPGPAARPPAAALDPVLAEPALPSGFATGSTTSRTA